MGGDPISQPLCSLKSRTNGWIKKLCQVTTNTGGQGKSAGQGAWQMPDLDVPPLHDGVQVKCSLDEHGPGLQVTLQKVHKGLLQHPFSFSKSGPHEQAPFSGCACAFDSTQQL